MALATRKSKTKPSRKIVLQKATASEIIRGLHATAADIRYVDKLLARMRSQGSLPAKRKKAPTPMRKVSKASK